MQPFPVLVCTRLAHTDTTGDCLSPVCRTSSSSFSSCRTWSEQDSAPSTGELSHCTKASPDSALRQASSPAPCRRPAARSLGPTGLNTTSHSSGRSPETVHMARSSSNTCKQRAHTDETAHLVRSYSDSHFSGPISAGVCGWCISTLPVSGRSPLLQSPGLLIAAVLTLETHTLRSADTLKTQNYGRVSEVFKKTIGSNSLWEECVCGYLVR